MRCPECHSSNLSVLEEGSEITISCLDCRFFSISGEKTDPFYIFLNYNFMREKTYKEGRIAFLSGQDLSDNPWSLKEICHEDWEKGYKYEMERMEEMGDFLSRIKKLEEEVSLQEQKITVLENNLLTSQSESAKMQQKIRDNMRFFIKLAEKKSVFGYSYRKDIEKYLESYSDEEDD